jgi:hypothetical protein
VDIGVMITKLESRLHAAEVAAKEALQTAKEGIQASHRGEYSSRHLQDSPRQDQYCQEMKTSPRDRDYDYQSTDRHGYPSYCDANFIGVTSYHTTHIFCCCCQ